MKTTKPPSCRWTLGALAFLAAIGGAPEGLARTYTHPGGEVLWTIVSQGCVQPFLDSRAVRQCQLISGADRPGGYVLLKSLEGVAQYLLMPADKVTGMEDPILLGPAPANYLAKAWYARGFVEALLHRPLQADEVSVAINSGEGRSQDQLHLHIDCIRTDVRQALAGVSVAGQAPFQTAITLVGHPYRVAAIPAAQLETTDPFLLLASALPDARAEMGEWTLVLTGAPRGAGDGALLLLAAKADLAAHIHASGEELQDHACGGLPAGAIK